MKINKMFYFLDTKNGTDRGTPMHDFIYNELVTFKAQNKIRSLNNDYIFRTTDGKPKESLIGKLFPKIVKQCGITVFVIDFFRAVAGHNKEYRDLVRITAGLFLVIGQRLKNQALIQSTEAGCHVSEIIRRANN